nr:tRNA lysidine(34) synthetase TilS [uncultured Psychroserpens sp.]
MQHKFKNHIHLNLSFLNDAKLLIAISGGLDSVVLTQLCKTLNLNITLAHCNFNLRGDESNADEAFVIDLANDLSLEVFIQNFSTEDYAKTHKLSTQLAARELRYNWFFDIAKTLNFDYILTAHHTDDNLETVLINLTRGTGLSGLTGIPEINDNIVRPLLPFSREELELYANNTNIKWREDSSNASNKYLRNKLRHEVIPILKEINPTLLQNFNTTVDNLSDTTDIVNDRISQFAENAIVSCDSLQLKFKISEFKKVKNPKAYLFGVFQTYGFTQWDDIVNLLDAQSGKQVFSNTYRLVKDREHLILTDIAAKDDKVYNIAKSDKQFKTPIGNLLFDEADAILGQSANVVFIDQDAMSFPLTLRRWREGDYFYPSGMRGKKKLSKYFKDEKFSIVDKDQTWLLCNGDAIVWVLGKRVDERFVAKKSTTNILKITLDQLF